MPAIDLRYLSFRLFNRLKEPFSERYRSRRMSTYVSLMGIREGMSVLDLGGQPTIWDYVHPRLSITVLNLPGVVNGTMDSHHDMACVEGNACHVHAYQDGQFDTVFSNSVIEHVGPPDRQAEFAREVRRLGRSYWVQTPSKWFPIEAHCGMPFWWFYPEKLRQYFLGRWRPKLPAWTDMVEGTTVLTKSDLRRLFPEATIYVERGWGVPKSYSAFHVGE